MVLGFGKSLSQLLKKASATQARQKADTSQPGHTHNNKESQGSQGGALTSVIPTPVPQPDNVMNNNFASDKAQALGADLFEGQEMVQQQNDIKNMRSTPSNLPGGRPENSSSYGDMFFNSPMNQGVSRSDMTKANKKSKMQTAQNDPKLQEGSDASYGINGYVNTEKEYKQALQKKNHPYIYDSPSKSPMNQGFGKYKKGDLMDESDQEDSMFKSTNSPGKPISGRRYNVENVSDIQVDKKGQFMTTLGDDEYYGMEKRPTSSRVTSYDQGKNAVRDTLRPIKGKKFKKLYKH